MPIDPETAAEIKSLKDKLLKIESDLSNLTGKELTEAKKEMSEMKASLSKLLTPAPEPSKPTDSPADPLAEFIETGKT